MTAIAPQSGFGERRLDVGRVGQEIFDLIQRDPMGTLGFSAALAAIQAGISLVLTLAGVTPAGGATGPAALARLSAMGPWFLLLLMIGIVIGVMVYGALGWGAVQALEGRTPTIAEKVRAAANSLLPMIGIAILAYLGILFGCLFLLVPGLFLAVLWSMVLMAQVVDGAGVFGSFGRSAALTKGHRWTIFLLFILFFVAAIVLGIAQFILLRLGALGGTTGTAIMSAVAQILIGGALNTLGAVGAGVVYHELRTLKGEFDPGRLNRVFG